MPTLYELPTITLPTLQTMTFPTPEMEQMALAKTNPNNWVACPRNCGGIAKRYATSCRACFLAQAQAKREADSESRRRKTEEREANGDKPRASMTCFDCGKRRDKTAKRCLSCHLAAIRAMTAAAQRKREEAILAKAAKASERKTKTEYAPSTIHRNAVGQRVTAPPPVPMVYRMTPAITSAPVPSPKRNTKGLTPRQVAIVDVILNRAHDLYTFAKIGAHFGTDRETMRREIRQIARDMGFRKNGMPVTVGTIRDEAHLRGFSTWQGRRVTAKDLEVGA